MRAGVFEIGGKEIRVTGRVLRIGRLEAEGFEFVEEHQALLRDLRAASTRMDLFTFTERLTALRSRHEYRMDWDNVAAIPITTFEAWWTTQASRKSRTAARRANRNGVEIREMAFDNALVQAIREIYNETPVRRGKPHTHYGKDLATVGREAATFLDSSVWIGAFLDRKLIGFAKLTMDAARSQARLMNFSAMIRHRQSAPANALMAAAVRFCADRRLPYLVYGNFTYGNKRDDGLTDFKRHNGFQRIDVPRYYVPLTRLGSAALRLGLHKRAVDRVPEPVLARLRGLRSAWYSRKLPLAH